MPGQHRQHNRLVTVTREARPVQRHHNLGARPDHVRDPVAEERPDINAVVAQQSVDLLDAVLAHPAHRLGQTLANCMDGQRGAGEHAQGCIGKRQDSFRMQVAVIQVRDEFSDVVSSQHGLLSHRLPPNRLEGAMVIPIFRIGNVRRLRPRNNGQNDVSSPTNSYIDERQISCAFHTTYIFNQLERNSKGEYEGISKGYVGSPEGPERSGGAA